MSGKDQIGKELRSMSRDRFERICIDLLERMGFKISTVKSIGGDIQVEGSIEKDEGPNDYLIKCTRSDDIIEEIRDMEKLVYKNIKGFILTPYKIDKSIDSKVEIAGLDEFYRLLEKFKILDDMEVEDEEVRSRIKKGLEKTKRLLDEDRPREAVDELVEIIKKDEGKKESWYLLSRAYEKLDSYENEIGALERALDIDEGYLDAWKSKGELHYQLEEYDESIKCFEKILEIEPDSPDIWNNMGLCYMKKGEYDEALRALDNALSLKEDLEQALLNKALIFERKNKINRTIDIAEELIEIYPDNPDYHYIKAAYLYKKGDLKKALDSVNNTLELDPENKDAQGLKEVLEQQIRAKKTSDLVGKDIKFDEGFDDLKKRKISLLLWKMGEDDEALRYAEMDDDITGCILYEMGDEGSAERSFKKNEIGLMNKEEIKYENEDFTGSKEILDKIRLLGEGSLVLNEKRGLTIERLDGFLDAEKIFDSILEKEDGFIDVFEEKYRCLIKGNHPSEEIEKDIDMIDKNRLKNLFSIVHYLNKEYEKSLELLNDITDIDNPIYFNNLGCVLYYMERFEDALKAFEKSVEKSDDEPVFLTNYGFCLIEEDMVEEAIKYLDMSTDADDSNPISWYYRGIALKRNGDERWKESIRKALELDPDLKEAEQLLE